MKAFKTVYAVAPGLVLLLLLTGCVSRVERVSSDEQIDLSGSWNDTDSRLVAEAMSADILSAGWIFEYGDRRSDRPAIVVGQIQNRTHEHISTATFISDIEQALIDSERVRVLQGGAFREQLRRERSEQQEHASADTAARLGREIGADYVLQGVVSSIVDSSRRERLIYYQVDLQLSNVETTEKVWLGTEEIKKLVRR
jgi:hypothetical protein